MNDQPTFDRNLKFVAIGSLVLFVAAVLMIIVGDPWWNLFVVPLGLFIAPLVGAIALVLMVRSRRRLP